MSNFDEIFDRIKLVTNTRTQVELAEVLDIRQSSISDAKRRNSVPSDWYMKLFERFGLNPDWLKKGSGPRYLRSDEGYTQTPESEMLMARENIALYGDPDAKGEVVSVYSMRESAETSGSSGEGIMPKVVGKLCVPSSMAALGVKVFKVDAAGMEPLILKGAFVGLDTQQKQIVSGDLYGVRLPYEGLSIKRVFLGASENAILRSENPQHPEISIPVGDLDEGCAGRVVWVINRF